MTASERLSVYYQNRIVGTLERDESDRFLFTYSQPWLDSGDSWPISQTIPLVRGIVKHENVHRFFANLLPEGRIRYLVTKRLGISEENDFELLKAIGGECAGALNILPEGEPIPSQSASGYAPIYAAELERIERSGSVFPVFAHEGAMRLSLAGAQDKLPVLMRGDDVLIPFGVSSSSHIIKFPNRDFHHLPENEVITTWIAASMDLPVAEVSLFRIASINTCMVLRYDRIIGENGMLARIHQEDFCQALGYPSQRKYELEGGPSIEQCHSLIERVSADPLRDAETLLRWQIFNLLAGNSDGHAKNLSLLYRDGLPARLAPLYDLVCTAVYPRIDTHLAFAIGGSADPGQIYEQNWRAMAQNLGISFPFVRSVVKSMASQIPRAAESAIGKFSNSYGETPVAVSIKKVVHERSRRILNSM